MSFLYKSVFLTLFIGVFLGLSGCGSDDVAAYKEDKMTVKTIEIK